MSTLHGDDVTIGGERSAVECLVKMGAQERSRSRHNMIGEDAGLEVHGRILNRVIKCERGGITIEADQRRVRELLKDLGLEQSNDDPLCCGKDESMRTDGSKGEKR